WNDGYARSGCTGPPPHRADARRGDVVPRAVRDRRHRALRAPVLLRLHGARLWMVARAGDVGECPQQVGRWTPVWLPCRLGDRPFRTAPADGGRNPDGRHRALRARVDPLVRWLLPVLSLQRRRLCVWRTAAESGAPQPLVHGGE